METFYDFVVNNFLEEPSPCGDLARDMKCDSNFPKESESKQEIRDYLQSYGDSCFRNSVIKAFKECWKEYKKNPKERRKIIKLKPCPFCGGKADIGRHPEKNSYQVRCMFCGAIIGENNGFDKFEATELWNTRK